MTTAKRITKYRKAKGLTMYRLALMAGLSESTINKIEHEKRNPDVATIMKIAEVLEISAWELIKNEGA